MDRRMFIDAMTASIVAAPLLAIAQKPTIVRRIGVLATEVPKAQADVDPEFAPLRALGWVEGQNLLVERRYVSGKLELLRPSAEELVRLKVEIIGTRGTPAALAAKSVTKTIPIVLWSAGDPVGSGLVATLARPGGNVTGFSLASSDTDAKLVELLRELMPGLQRVGMLEPANHPYYRARRGDLEQACRSLGVQPIFFEVATQVEVDNALMEMARRGAQALIVPTEPLFYENAAALMAAASRYALPTVAQNGELIDAGALAVLTYSRTEQHERFAWFVDKILRGAKPAELPIQQPTRFVLVVNLRAAKALGLTIPRSTLLRADKVVE